MNEVCKESGLPSGLGSPALWSLMVIYGHSLPNVESRFPI